MSKSNPLQCPACRARQPLQDRCRRCAADMTLLVKIRRRIDWLNEQRDQALRSGQADRVQEISKELKLLAGPGK